MEVLRYNKFLEAKLADVSLLKGNSDIIKKIKDYQEMDFDFQKSLLRFLTLDKRMGKKKIRLEISWNDTAVHNIKQRVKERTSFKSVEEFNDNLKVLLNSLFPDKIGSDIFRNGKYSLYDKEHNMTIIFYIDINKFINGDHNIEVSTVLPGMKGNGVVKIIQI